MRYLTAACLLVATIGVANAAERIDKFCIFESARYLPAVPGLIIVASRAEAKPGGRSFAIEIDIKAAGQEATYKFICVSPDGRSAVVQMNGLK